MFWLSGMRKIKRDSTCTRLPGGKGTKNTLDDILDRLDRGRAELNVRITTTHVGLSGTIHDGFLAALSIVCRVDENVQRVLGERDLSLLLGLRDENYPLMVRSHVH